MKTSLRWHCEFLLRTPLELYNPSSKELVKTLSNILGPITHLADLRPTLQWQSRGPLLRHNCRSRWVQTPPCDAGQSWFQENEWSSLIWSACVICYGGLFIIQLGESQNSIYLVTLIMCTVSLYLFIWNALKK